MEEEVFDFGTSSTEFAPSSDIHFDGMNLICKKIDGVQEDCNKLPLNERVSIILFSLEVSPRETEFYGDTDDLRWERNQYSIHGSKYNIKCKGIIKFEVYHWCPYHIGSPKKSKIVEYLLIYRQR